MLVIRIVQVCV